MEILLIKVIFADGKPIGDGSRHIKDTPIKYEDRMCKYSLRKFIRQFRNKWGYPNSQIRRCKNDKTKGEEESFNCQENDDCRCRRFCSRLYMSAD